LKAGSLESTGHHHRQGQKKKKKSDETGLFSEAGIIQFCVVTI
jgi:hypothetical protein